MLTYLNSLEKLIQLNPSCLLPSHGPPIGGAVHRLSAYIKHRLSREELIVDAIKQSDGSLVDIVNRAYRDVPEILRAGPDGGICGRSTRAHLEKLDFRIACFWFSPRRILPDLNPIRHSRAFGQTLKAVSVGDFVESDQVSTSSSGA